MIRYARSGAAASPRAKNAIMKPLRLARSRDGHSSARYTGTIELSAPTRIQVRKLERSSLDAVAQAAHDHQAGIGDVRAEPAVEKEITRTTPGSRDVAGADLLARTWPGRLEEASRSAQVRVEPRTRGELLYARDPHRLVTSRAACSVRLAHPLVPAPRRGQPVTTVLDPSTMWALVSPLEMVVNAE